MRHLFIRKSIVVLAMSTLFFPAFSNNIQVTNISLENLDEGAKLVDVQFDIGWENSWRLSAGPSNWDAAWIFIKFRANNGPWSHAYLDSSSPSVPGATVSVSPDKVGAMLHRDSDGSGDVSYTAVQLTWNYGPTGVSLSDVLDIQVFAIEMIYIPEGAFYVGGTSGTEVNKFYAGGMNTETSFQITSENALAIADSNGQLFYSNSSGSGGDQMGVLEASYPKGFEAFYLMKYEVSEAQWLGFFNSLTPTQKANRDLTDTDRKNSDAVVNRNTISWDGGTASAISNAPDRALNFVSVEDVNAYLDWAGLRPMTELEFEKACRGPLPVKPGEFAWGNANVASTDYQLVNNGQPNELISNPEVGTGNAMYTSTNGVQLGPLRNGIFAASAVNKNREETGGTYYGVMEMSGNLSEMCVTVGSATGRGFSGLHGDGRVDSAGDGTVVDWPSSYGLRGSNWWQAQSLARMRVSDRTLAAHAFTGGHSIYGFRAARTAF